MVPVFISVASLVRNGASYGDSCGKAPKGVDAAPSMRGVHACGVHGGAPVWLSRPVGVVDAPKEKCGAVLRVSPRHGRASPVKSPAEGTGPGCLAARPIALSMGEPSVPMKPPFRLELMFARGGRGCEPRCCGMR